MYLCAYCNKECKNIRSLRSHERMCPKNPNELYRKKFTTKGKDAWNKGLTKENNTSIAKQAIAITKKKPDWQREVDDDNKLYQRFLNKKINAKAENLECELTFKQYCLLVKEAGLVSSQLGFTGDDYVLARYNDEGNYTYGNCRFIKQIDNARERKISDKSRQASSKNITQYNNNKYNN